MYIISSEVGVVTSVAGYEFSSGFGLCFVGDISNTSTVSFSF